MTWTLSFRDAPRGGAVTDGVLVSGNLNELKVAERVTFLLHGFNVDEEKGLQRLGKLGAVLEKNLAGEAIILTLWPGDCFAGYLLGAAAYQFQGQDADDTAKALIRFIADTLAPKVRISFVSHSLGARVVMETVKGLPGADCEIGQICLLAAAIDDYSLAAAEDYRAAAERAERIAVLASKRDKVLKYAYPVGDFLQSFIYFWKDSAGLALGYHGPRPDAIGGQPPPANVAAVQIPNSANVGHGDYISEVGFAGQAPAKKSASAARFSLSTLKGEAELRYVP